MVCPRCSGSTVYRDENGIPHPCCRTGIVPTGPYSAESAVGCATPVTLPKWDARTVELTGIQPDPPWQHHPATVPLCPPSLAETLSRQERGLEPSNPRSPNIAAWLKGGCMVCGSLLRDGKVYAHNACCDRTDHETFAHWVGLCDAAKATPSAPAAPGVANGRDCAHGRLARSCSECSNAEEIAELRAYRERNEEGKAKGFRDLAASRAEVEALKAKVAEAEAKLEVRRFDVAPVDAARIRNERDAALARAEAAEKESSRLRIYSKGGTLAADETAALRAERDAAIARATALEGALGPLGRWPTVYEFALAMVAKLDANRSKKGGREGWQDDHPAALLRRVREETDELSVALGASPKAEVLNEAADVANMAMMVADASGCFRGEPIAALSAPSSGGLCAGACTGECGFSAWTGCDAIRQWMGDRRAESGGAE